MLLPAGAFVLFAVALGSGAHVAEPGMRASAALAVMAIGGTVLAYLFWSMGIMRLGASPTAAQLAGGFLVLCGVTVSMLRTA